MWRRLRIIHVFLRVRATGDSPQNTHKMWSSASVGCEGGPWIPAQARTRANVNAGPCHRIQLNGHRQRSMCLNCPKTVPVLLSSIVHQLCFPLLCPSSASHSHFQSCVPNNASHHCDPNAAPQQCLPRLFPSIGFPLLLPNLASESCSSIWLRTGADRFKQLNKILIFLQPVTPLTSMMKDDHLKNAGTCTRPPCHAAHGGIRKASRRKATCSLAKWSRRQGVFTHIDRFVFVNFDKTAKLTRDSRK